jgi:hypothetical protein
MKDTMNRPRGMVWFGLDESRHKKTDTNNEKYDQDSFIKSSFRQTSGYSYSKHK